MKMKKIWIALLAAALLFVVTGCGTESETVDEQTAVMASFSTTTVDGDAFTDKELKSYDLTMVNVWTTWCSYCVMEMPDLQLVYDNLPANVNMITVCADGDSEGDFAIDILEENSCTFPALIPDENLESSLLSLVYSYPTTFFVDQNGNLVGNSQIGVPQSGDSAADAYLTLIDERLDQLN